MHSIRRVAYFSVVVLGIGLVFYVAGDLFKPTQSNQKYTDLTQLKKIIQKQTDIEMPAPVKTLQAKRTEPVPPLAESEQKTLEQAQRLAQLFPHHETRRQQRGQTEIPADHQWAQLNQRLQRIEQVLNK